MLIGFCSLKVTPIKQNLNSTYLLLSTVVTDHSFLLRKILSYKNLKIHPPSFVLIWPVPLHYVSP
jgi:hypothetical protein